MSRAAAERAGPDARDPGGPGGIDAYLGMLGLGATGDGDVAVIVGSSTCHLAQSRDGRLRLGSGRLLSRRDRRGALHDRGRPDRHRLDPRLVSPPLRRPRAGRGRAAGRERLPGARRAGRRRARRAPRAWSSATTGRGTARRTRTRRPAARSSGLSLAHGPGHVFRALYEATACGTRHILEDAAGARPAGRADLPRRRRGAVAALAPDPRRHPQEADPPDPRERVRAPSARPWPPRSPPGSTATSTRPPAPWSPSRRSSSPTRPTPRSTTTSSAATSSSTGGSMPA